MTESARFGNLRRDHVAVLTVARMARSTSYRSCAMRRAAVVELPMKLLHRLPLTTSVSAGGVSPINACNQRLIADLSAGTARRGTTSPSW